MVRWLPLAERRDTRLVIAVDRTYSVPDLGVAGRRLLADRDLGTEWPGTSPRGATYACGHASGVAR
jgi:hypothetical protein